MIYAPVAIATLNRYEHLKKCLRTLERNEWAQYTEIFISVDYPTKESHRSGYEKILEYLKDKKMGFKAIHVYIQEKNLGPNKNFNFIRERAFEKYDCVICMEDDIEVADNFLEYMDKALAWGRKNQYVYCICGYFPTQSEKMQSLIEGKEFFLRQAYNPWGVGEYLERRTELINTVTEQWLDDVGKNLKAMMEIYRYRKYTFYMFVVKYLMNKSDIFFNSDGSLKLIDITQDIYMLLNNKYAIFPTRSKTRNCGFDGSGVNCKEKTKVVEISFDNRKNVDISNEMGAVINKRLSKQFSYAGITEKKELYKALVWYFVYWGKNLFKK